MYVVIGTPDVQPAQINGAKMTPGTVEYSGERTRNTDNGRVQYSSLSAWDNAVETSPQYPCATFEEAQGSR